MTKMYDDLKAYMAPRHLIQALKTIGTVETKGAGNNPTILKWADEVGDKAGTSYAKWAADWYDKDSIPWCGLWVAVIMVRANRPIAPKYLSAKEWATWGKGVGDPMLGDVLVFARDGGGHVGLYVGEDSDCYHVLGGNQGDKVSITRLAKGRMIAARRPLYNIQPDSVKRIFRAANGPVSVNEG